MSTTCARFLAHIFISCGPLMLPHHRQPPPRSRSRSLSNRRCRRGCSRSGGHLENEAPRTAAPVAASAAAAAAGGGRTNNHSRQRRTIKKHSLQRLYIHTGHSEHYRAQETALGVVEEASFLAEREKNKLGRRL